MGICGGWAGTKPPWEAGPRASSDRLTDPEPLADTSNTPPEDLADRVLGDTPPAEETVPAAEVVVAPSTSDTPPPANPGGSGFPEIGSVVGAD